MRAPKHILSLSLLFALLPLAQEEEGDAQALFSKLAGMAVELGLESSGSKSISLEDDPYLGKLGEDILKLLVERDAEDYLDSSVATPEMYRLWNKVRETETHRAQAISSPFSALKHGVEGVLDLAAKLALPDEEGAFQVKSIRVGSLNSISREILWGSGIEIQLALAPDAIGEPDRKYQGEYVLYVASAIRSVDGWGLVPNRMGWTGLPDALLGEHERTALSFNALWKEEDYARLAEPGATVVGTEGSGSDSPDSITMEDDPSLGRLGKDILRLLVERDASAYLDSSVASPESLGHAIGIGEAAITAARAQIISALEDDVEGMLELASKLDLPDEEGAFQVKSIKVGTLLDRNRSGGERLDGADIEIRLELDPDAIEKLDVKYQGEYVLYADGAMRSADGWGLFGRKIRWISLPEALLGEEDKTALLAEAYLKEHGTLMPGTAAPEFAFYGLEEGGEFHSKAELKGKVVVLEFWATWCGPCQEPMAKLQAYVDRNPGWKGRVEVLALSIDSAPEKALAHLERNGWTSTRNVWSGPGEWNAGAAQAFKLESIPTMYVIGANGMIAEAGSPNLIDVPALVEHLLDNPGYTAPRPSRVSPVRVYTLPPGVLPSSAAEASPLLR